MKILLVNPPSNPGRQTPKENGMYPFSVLFLASYVKKYGYDTKILDISVCSSPMTEFKNFLGENKYDIIGFTSSTENRFLTWDLITEAKKIIPSSAIIVGGQHYPCVAEEALAKIPEIDIIVRGEGEITFLELLEAIKNNRGYENISGLTYKKDGSIIHNPPRPVEKNLDQFMIDEDVSKNIILPGGGSYSPFISMDNLCNIIPIMVGRGCPGRCVYCGVSSRICRFISIETLIDEIRKNISRYNSNSFCFYAPFFLSNKKYILEFCQRIQEEKITIQWWAETRADIDLAILPVIKKAGCRALDVGYETGSPVVQKAIKKNIPLEVFPKIIDNCHKLDIKLKIFTMISLPDEKEEDVNTSLKYIKQFKKKVLIGSPAITRIYPGTEIELMARTRSVIPGDFSWFDRDYVNKMPDIVQTQIPVRIENIDPDKLRTLLDRYRKEIGPSVLNKINTRLQSFLFNWSGEAIRKKGIWIKSFFRSLFQ